eukprot:TRINITY_DN329_c0_g1_i4.p4 TRINITY_DN329_c0_g1~~TRINITY_DN329_c0_g1_i4.p4  ORF type:complete len:107 (-),score=33.98 TRINITY_DN329_c0_g1_i4:27-347(-)
MTLYGEPELASDGDEERRRLKEQLSNWRAMLRTRKVPRRRLRRKTAAGALTGGVSNFDVPKRKVRWGNLKLGARRLGEKVQLSTNNAGRVLGKMKKEKVPTAWPLV